MPAAGSYDRRVRFERKGDATDPDYGGTTGSANWVPVAGLEEVWVAIQDTLPSRAEVIAQGLEQSYQPSRVRMRWVDIAINAEMRIIDIDRGDRILEVVTEAAEYGGRRQELEFMVNRYVMRGDA
jgi:hypothetical protein